MENGTKICHCTLNSYLFCDSACGHQAQIRDLAMYVVKDNVCLEDVTIYNILHH